jgi:signal transduction histidine kinase
VVSIGNGVVRWACSSGGISHANAPIDAVAECPLFEERLAERVRVAREVATHTAQSFQGHSSLPNGLRTIRCTPGRAKEVLGGSIDQTAQAITEGREAVQGLRASTVGAMTAPGHPRLSENSSRPKQDSATSVGLHVQVEGMPQNLHPIVRDEIYQVASEALRNAFRHARATDRSGIPL